MVLTMQSKLANVLTSAKSSNNNNNNNNNNSNNANSNSSRISSPSIGSISLNFASRFSLPQSISKANNQSFDSSNSLYENRHEKSSQQGQQQQFRAQSGAGSSANANANTANKRMSNVHTDSFSSMMPDLSYLSEEERKAIEKVLERQRAEEEKDSILIRSQSGLTSTSDSNHNYSKENETSLYWSRNDDYDAKHDNNHNTNNSKNKVTSSSSNMITSCQRHSISDIAQEVKQRYGSIDTGALCDLCKKTKFTSSAVGHTCFYCKLRCCIRCSYKMSTKTKQTWICAKCKKKQEVLLKSGQWLNSPVLNKKNFSSDYILNKTQSGGARPANHLMYSSNTNAPRTTATSSSSSQAAASKRMLPNLTQLTKQSSLDPNATNSHDELSSTTKGKYNNNINPTIVKLKQPLIKQVSLSNPPMCYRNLNDDEAYSENSIYESNNSQTKSFTSNQELKKMLSSSSAYSNAGEAVPNGQTASSYLPASRSGKLEKLGDPTLMLKNRHQTTSTGRQTTTNDDYDAINRSTKSSNALLRTDSLSSEATSDKSKPLNEHDQHDEYNEDDEEDEAELERAAKTVSTAPPPPRKQPSIPAALSNTDPNVIKNKLLIKYASNKQQSSLTSSDDETNISEEIRNAKNQDDQDEEVDDDDEEEEEDEEEQEEDEEEIDQDEEDEEEDDNDLEEDELDEEVRSITECTTNDETELESAASTSVRRGKSNQHESSSLHSASKLNNLSSTQINTNDSNSRRKPPLIDNYLVQNLEKEEILAAKINKFLSPPNWQLSTNGKKMIGNVVLKRNMTTASTSSIMPSLVNSSSSSTIDSISDFSLTSSLGLKVVGGKTNPLTNQVGAYIVKVKKNSIADTVGHLQPGDEVVKWNGVSLTGLSFDEVYSIIDRTKQEPQIELVIERFIDDGERDRLINYVRDKQFKHQDSAESSNIATTTTANRNNNLPSHTFQYQQQQQQQQQKKTSTTLSNVSSSSPIGKIQLKILHDSIENKINVHLVAFNLNTTNSSSSSNKHHFNDPKQQQQISTNYGTQQNNDVESIFCKLNLLTKKKIDLFTKSGQICHLVDRETGLFNLNSVFTFEAINSDDLKELCIDVDVVDYKTKQTIGKVNIDLSSSEMLENQLLNLNMYATTTTTIMNESTAAKLSADRRAKFTNNASIESTNSGSGAGGGGGGGGGPGSTTGSGIKRRQLPQIPGMITAADKQSRDKGGSANLSAQKANKPTDAKENMANLKKYVDSSISDSETTNSGHHQQRDSADTSQTHYPSSAKQQQQQRSTNENEKSFDKYEQQMRQNKKLTREDSSIGNFTTSNIPLKQNQKQSQQQQDAAKLKNASTTSANAKDDYDSSRKTSPTENELNYGKEPAGGRLLSDDVNYDMYEYRNSNALTSSSEYLSDTKTTTRGTGGGGGGMRNKGASLGSATHAMKTSHQLTKNFETTTSKPDLLDPSANEFYESHHNTKLSKSPYLSTSTQSISHNEENQYLNLNKGRFVKNGAYGVANQPSSSLISAMITSTTGGGVASGGAATYSSSHLVLSPSQTFGQQALQSTPALNRPMPGSSRPERLFSATHLSQMKNTSTKNINKITAASADFLNNVGSTGRSGLAGIGSTSTSTGKHMNDAIDSDASDNSQPSNASKMSSTSLISGQSEFNKLGANNNTKQKIVSNLTMSDPNRMTIVSSTNAAGGTTTTVLNKPSSSLDSAVSDFSSSFPTDKQQQPSSSQQQANAANKPKTDGTQSDSALSNPITGSAPGTENPNNPNKKRRPSMAKALVILGLSKKSNSASNLSSSKRFGFARSEEYGVMPELRSRNHSSSAGTSESSAEDKKPRLWSGALKLPHELPFNDFIERLGPGQKVSRQVLGLPCLGEVKLSMSLVKQKLNIEVIELKNIKQRTGYKILPNIYVKIYLFHRHSCVEKLKTTAHRRTLSASFQETLKFNSDYKNSVLQVTVWADYGKLDRKVFMGIAQIMLDDCDLSSTVSGWYRLYSIASIITDFSTLASVSDLSATESGYSISSQKSVK